jgi:FeS assembly SUF system protein
MGANAMSQRDDDRRVDDLKRRKLPVVSGEPEQPDVSEWTAEGGAAPAGPVDQEAMRERVLGVLKDIHDPEIPVNIYDLGLIYGFEVDEAGSVEIKMTLTAPACPVAGWLVKEVAERVGAVEGVSRSHVSLVWDPPWTMERMSEEAQLELGLL